MHTTRAKAILFSCLILLVVFQFSPAHAGSGTWSYSLGAPQENFNAIWGSSDTDIFAVGAEGKIVHYDGTSWSAMESGISYDLFGVWGSSPTDVFAVGDEGNILHYNGTSWSAMAGGSGKYLLGIWGSSATDIFAAGSSVYGKSKLLHYDGIKWSAMSTNYDVDFGTLNCIWGTSATNVFAAGDGFILHYDGSTWTSMGNTYPYNLSAIWGSSENDIFAVSPGGAMFATGDAVTILHYNGISWSAMETGLSNTYLTGVWGSTSDNVYAVGRTADKWSPDGWIPSAGVVLHYDGSTWSEVDTGITDSLAAVWGASAESVYIAGGGVETYMNETNTGVIGHYNGSSWTTPYYKERPTVISDPGVYAIWGSSSCNVFALSGDSQILHYNGASWSVAAQGKKYSGLNAIWGSSATDIFAVGYDAFYPRYSPYYKPKILHYNGKAWRSMDTSWVNFEGFFLDVWGCSESDVFALGTFDGGAWSSYYGHIIAHYDGRKWSQMYSEPNSFNEFVELYAIWGSSGSDVFAVGEDVGSGSIIWRYDGDSWSVIERGTTDHWNDVWGSSGADVFAVGSDGSIAHYNGISWTAMNSGTTVPLYGVWGSSATDVFAAGHLVILHYDGASWSISKGGPTGHYENYKSIWGASGADVFAVGDAIFHYSDGAGADECACELKIIPSAIHKLLSLANPIHSFVLIGATDTHFISTDKPQWGTAAIKTLVSLMISQRAILALTCINPFQLEAGEYEVTVGNCTGTVEVKPL